MPKEEDKATEIASNEDNVFHFEWFPELETGHPEIDEDHKKLVELINLVSDAIEANDGDRCKKMFASFVEFAEDHFRREEVILKKIGFPKIDHHIEYHNKLLVDAHKTRDRCESAEGGLLKECFNELVGFLVDDILKGDIEFIPYMMEHNVVPSNPSLKYPKL